MAAALSIIILLSVLRRRRRRKRLRKTRRTCWTRQWIKRRQKLGAFHALVRELSDEDPKGFKNFLRMDQLSFAELDRLVSPLIKRRDTIMREAISPSERLALTLRFLASGRPIHSHKVTV